MADKHEVVFQWPHSEPNTVIVTGTFDDWAKEIHLEKDTTGFRGSVRIGWNEKIAYKFIVDGEWMVLEGEPTEADGAGNINNIYTAP
ncbi:carbohydrate-binding module family 48 protein, partial [Collybia nuda]